jgi:hypothetical protein
MLLPATDTAAPACHEQGSAGAHENERRIRERRRRCRQIRQRPKRDDLRQRKDGRHDGNRRDHREWHAAARIAGLAGRDRNYLITPEGENEQQQGF